MDSNRIQGAATEFGGRVKEAAGALIGDSALRVEGYYDEAEGRAQNAVGRAKDYVSSQPIGSILVAGFIGFAFGVLAGRSRG